MKNENRPSLFLSRSETRSLLRFLCIVAAFYSILLTAFSIQFTWQLLTDSIPLGTIRTVKLTHGLDELVFNDGTKADLSRQVLENQPELITLAVGDRLEKQWGSATYSINGKAVTDRHWIISRFLFSPQVMVTLGAYSVLGLLYVILYQRMPLFGKPSAAAMTGERSFRAFAKALSQLVCAWIGLVVLLAILLIAFFGCLSSVARDLFHRG